MRVGLIGCGKIGWRHLDAYRTLGVKDIVVFDRDQQVARNVSGEFDVPIAATAPEILENPAIGAVDICSPTPFHYETAMTALRHGKHVFCEKPVSQSAGEVRSLLDLARREKRVVQVGYLYRFFPAFTKLKEWVDQGILGKPYHAILRLGGRGSAANWKHGRATGGGAISEMLTHMFDMALWLFGEMKSVQCLHSGIVLAERDINGSKMRADAEDYIVARLRNDYMDILCEGDLVTPSFMNYVEVQGDNGSVFSSSLHYLPTVLFLKKSKGIYSQGNNFYNYPVTNVMVDQLKAFMEACGTNDPSDGSLVDSLHVVEWMSNVRLPAGD